MMVVHLSLLCVAVTLAILVKSVVFAAVSSCVLPASAAVVTGTVGTGRAALPAIWGAALAPVVAVAAVVRVWVAVVVVAFVRVSVVVAVVRVRVVAAHVAAVVRV